MDFLVASSLVGFEPGPMPASEYWTDALTHSAKTFARGREATSVPLFRRALGHITPLTPKIAMSTFRGFTERGSKYD